MSWSILTLENKQFGYVNTRMASKSLSLATDLLRSKKDNGLWQEFTIDHMVAFRKELRGFMVVYIFYKPSCLKDWNCAKQIYRRYCRRKRRRKSVGVT